jgi:ribonuclease P protein component
VGGVSGNGTSPRGGRGRFSHHGGRLLRTRDFEAVYRSGERRTSARFAAYFRANGLDRTRFGISVGRALGNAVRRNRIRRRIREILRLHRGEIATGWDIVIHPRSSVAAAEFARVTAELVGLLRHAVGASEGSRPS